MKFNETDVVKIISDLDLLDRQEFVDKLLLISDILSRNKKNACYAIDGSWGVGKSFVLDMFEEQAQVIQQDNTTLSKYLIFRYNCWEYDYYEEPLIAIVASLLDGFDKKVHLISKSKQKAFVEILKVVGKRLLKNAIKVVDKATGLPFEAVAEVLEEGVSSSKNTDAESKSFDEYISFKNTLKELQEGIASVSEDQTVIFVVDELDRCLPEYSIKVLERIHHLFRGTSNVQVILSMDKDQLSHVVKQIYGEKTDVDKYLSKFIGFELKLTEGSISDQEKSDARFKEYVELFDFIYDTTKTDDVSKFSNMVLDGIDMRNKISILDKCLLLHSMINKSDDKVDSVYMCIELLLAVVKYHNVDLNRANKHFNVDNLFAIPKTEVYPKGLKAINDKYNDPNAMTNYITNDYSGACIRGSDVWGAALLCYRRVLGFQNDSLLYGSYDYIELKKYAMEFWELMLTIC